MENNNKLRIFRNISQLTQEEMAEKLGMSVAGYAKIERGQTKLNFDKLEQIAQIFNISVEDFVSFDSNRPFWIFGENNSYNTANYYGAESAVNFELEKQRLEIEFYKKEMEQKDLLVAQQHSEIETLKKLIAFLEKD